MHTDRREVICWNSRLSTASDGQRCAVWIDDVVMLVAVTIAFLTTLTIGGIMLLIRNVLRAVQSIRSIQFGDHCEQSEIQADRIPPHAGRRRLVRVLYRLEVASHYHKQIEGHNNLPLDQ